MLSKLSLSLMLSRRKVYLYVLNFWPKKVVSNQLHHVVTISSGGWVCNIYDS
jgi:hypothetical protein